MAVAETIQRAPKIRLITFGGGSPAFLSAVKRLERQADAFALIDEFRGYTPEDLPSDVRSTFLPETFEKLRGYGYWRWKSYLIARELEELRDGDVLIYLDAGAEINPAGRDRFTYYLDAVSRNEVLFFAMPYQHRNWTKRDPLLLNLQDHFFRNQISAGFIMLRATTSTRLLATEWNQRSALDRGRLLKDEPEVLFGAVEHRHDQAVLSQLIFEHGFPTTAPDETFFQPWSSGRSFPFLLLRNRTGVSRLRYVLRPRPLRFLLYILSPIQDREFALDRVKYYWLRLQVKLGLQTNN